MPKFVAIVAPDGTGRRITERTPEMGQPSAPIDAFVDGAASNAREPHQTHVCIVDHLSAAKFQFFWSAGEVVADFIRVEIAHDTASLRMSAENSATWHNAPL